MLLSTTCWLTRKPAAACTKLIAPLYYDDGRRYTIEDILAIVFMKHHSYEPILNVTMLTVKGQGKDVTIEIANAGISNLKLVEIIVEPSSELLIIANQLFLHWRY